MTPIWHLSLASIANRRLAAMLTVLAVALSVALLLGVERVRNDARAGFAQTLSGTDLVVGARAGAVQLLLYSVFHIGDATNNVSWASIEEVAALPQVAWLVPIALGDSHRGHRVVGTTGAFFEHYRYGERRALRFAAGRAFAGMPEGLFEVVLGAEVAARFGYRVGERIVLSHGGAGGPPFAEHGDKPFTVVGVLARSGTPVDRALLVGLEGLEAIHIDWQGGAPVPGVKIGPEHVRKFDLAPKSVTAALLGLESRTAVFRVQRWINAYAGEPLSAILPGVTLQELWSLVGMAEKALLAVSALVVMVGLAGLVAVVVASLGERRRELAILRALGAGPGQVFALLAVESLLLALAGCALGLGLLYGAGALAAPWLGARHGLQLSLGLPAAGEWGLLAAVLGASLLASLVPALRAYRYSLADGMTIRI
ncbi:ABC transporter permease [Thauera chlorobenzoica]|uniref:ABC-type antimicrobial peptide transport system, permease n=1 Tax=Thauera chlorobenzoica TaxID=96773 RepID=A0A1H5WTZ8_9RHOO|nr:FtsX-like permease family protein [Thauera chlorobenzoica]APR04542.1 ABC-type antimicrobial peptide transport system, permease [Thauera chlorobenzoica]SEG02793.1 putative ABC transport system permease protein [Thauera chlorobenzoica]